jgi:hypothetical protein
LLARELTHTEIIKVPAAKQRRDATGFVHFGDPNDAVAADILSGAGITVHQPSAPLFREWPWYTLGDDDTVAMLDGGNGTGKAETAGRP